METITNTSVSQEIIEKIQNMIISGELKKGDQLPPERQMTEALGVGRSALREALKALEIIGLIEKKQGNGNFVSSNVGMNYFKPLSLSFWLKNGPITDVLDLRIILEGFAIREACSKAAAADIRRLTELHEAMMNAQELPEKTKLDRDFHYEIAHICGNQLIVDIMESVSFLMDALFDKSVEGDQLDAIYAEHGRMIELIRRGNQDAAASAMEVHLTRINTTLENQK